ncbi:MAG: hypothetical protein DMG60_00470 [Acidobacteria bacterium]|nr:MAG: hypothetical protein DMG60_00470 [Acidobacteriota bacterium]
MTVARRTSNTAKAVCLLIAALFVWVPRSVAVEPAVPSSVDVYWQSTRTIAAPGVTSVIVLDEEIAHAQLGNDAIEFAGLSRGDTVVLAYVDGKPVSIVVHVIPHPIQVVPPSLQRREAEFAHGVFGSDVQFSSAQNTSNVAFLSSLGWSQQVGDHYLDFSSQVEDNTQFGGHEANLRTAAISYRTPHVMVNAIDFNQSLSGALGEDRVNNFSTPSIMQLRGGAVTFDAGKNEFSLFAGATIPYYFLSLNATRDVAGFSFHRRQTNKLNFFGSTSYVNIPTSLPTGTVQRREYAMQNLGVSYRLGQRFLVGAQGGASNRGGMLRGDLSYSSFRFSGYASVISASQTFPLNQLQSLFSGTSSVKGGLSYRWNSRLTHGLYVDHSTITPGLIYRVRGSNDYLSPSAALSFQFSVRDSISLPIKGQSLLLGVEHDRVNPSLITKLNQELNLLSPQLQAQFLANPAAFVDSTNFPPEIKALLAAEQPIGTTVSASTTIALKSKLRFSPNVSATYASNGALANTWTQSFGYSLVYQFRPDLQFRSSLSNVLLWDARQNSTLRTTILSVGFQKNFTAAPGTLPLFHRGRIIEGHVFRDNNINGAFNAGEPGLPGIDVRLDDGQVATTDAEGRYRFTGLSADEHQISVNLTQFRQPVRMTTRSEATADLIQQHIVIENFGILDFARVMGSIYNDLRFENRRQPDSKGLQGIGLLLEGGKEARTIQTIASGDFEFDNVPPGDYKLSLDAASLPPNYLAPTDSISVHVSPVSTVIEDLPMRALRSIGGRVLLRVQDDVAANSATTLKQNRAPSGHSQSSPEKEEPEMVPVAGVRVTAGPSTATTDKEGKFLLRNLPAGDLNVSIRPVRSVPAGINIPTGSVKLPPEPIQIQGATIVVTNAELLPYLTDDMLKAPTARGQQAIASAYTRAHERDKQQPSVGVTVSSAPQPKSPSPTQPPLQQKQPPMPPVTKTLVPAQVQPVTKAQASTAATIAPPVVRSGEQKTISYDAVSRAICQSMPSLGEAAQCFNQLKRTAATNSQK